jgi:23S rRNA (guanine745-N1)-methyltransferase
MTIRKANNLACPLDGLPLAMSDKQGVCPNGHSFDVARQGYLHLLPVQHKRSKNPGDSAEMVQARTAFLNSGAYAPIADKLNELTRALLAATPSNELCVLDAGCGEGYYLAHLLPSLQAPQLDKSVALIGVDISKPAILAAAKRSKQITWLIASNKHAPLLPGTVDVILSVFGFPLFDRFKPLLAPRGKIILVDAGPQHLIELRNIVYRTVTKSGPPDFAAAAAAAAGFSLVEQSALTYVRTLDSNAQVMNLLTMTPHYFRASREGKAAAEQLRAMDVTIDAVFRVVERGTA